MFKGFPRQEHWSGLPFPSPGDLPDQGIEPVSPALVGGFFITEPPGELMYYIYRYTYIYIYIILYITNMVFSNYLRLLQLKMVKHIAVCKHKY